MQAGGSEKEGKKMAPVNRDSAWTWLTFIVNKVFMNEIL